MNKHIFTFLILLSASIFSTSAIDFAPIGATWYYEMGHFDELTQPNPDFNRLESVKDTLYHGKLCRKIVKTDRLECSDRPEVEYLYTSNDSVFFFDPVVDDFQLLYNFNAEKGDSWEIYINSYDREHLDTLTISVDSVDYVELNGSELKRLHVTYAKRIFVPYESQIIEQIGDIQYLFNYVPNWAEVCDADYIIGLCSYFDTHIGLYDSGKGGFCDNVISWNYTTAYDLKTESADPGAIDTTLFSFRNDTLFVRNINREFCCTTNLFAEYQRSTDSLKINVIAVGNRCLMDCSFGYSLKFQMAPFDTLQVTINGESFQVIYNDIVNRVSDISESKLKVYPNPVSQQLTIDAEGIKSIKIYALSGQLVSNQVGSKNIIAVNQLEPGVYMVHVETYKGNYIQKVIKD